MGETQGDGTSRTELLPLLWAPTTAMGARGEQLGGRTVEVEFFEELLERDCGLQFAEDRWEYCSRYS